MKHSQTSERRRTTPTVMAAIEGAKAALVACSQLVVVAGLLAACSSSSPTAAPIGGTGGAAPSDGGMSASDARMDDGRRPDASGPEVVFPLLGANVAHIHIDERLLWWEHGERVYQGPRDGSSEPKSLGAADAGAANRFADDATHIYWLSRDRIVRAPKAGGAIEEWPLGQALPFGAWAMDESSVYITNAYASALYKMPKGGGTLEVVTSDLNTQGDGGGAVRLTLAGDIAYVGYLGDVFRIELASGVATRIATGLAQVSNVVVAGDAAYWLDCRTMGGADVYRYRAGGQSEKIAHTATPTLTGTIVADEARRKLYYFPRTFSALTSFDLDSSVFADLTEPIWSTRYIAADSTMLYWTRNAAEAPAVMRLRKP